MSAAKPHACTVDYSRETGALVVCTCGFALGPFRVKANAHEEAKRHRLVHAEPAPPPTPEQRERDNAAQRARWAAARAAASDRDGG